jgi:hypothetical protein
MRFNCVGAALLPVAAIAQIFPVPEGDYKVQWANKELVDYSRVDPFNATHQRRMMISRFTPVPNKECIKTCRTPYMTPNVAKIEDDILTEYLGDIGWPHGALAKLDVEMCCEVKKGHGSHNNGRKAPTLLFGTGLNTTRLFYTATAQHLAALGYEVIVMDHPYETDVVEFPDGEVIFGGHIGRDPNNTAELQRLCLMSSTSARHCTSDNPSAARRQRQPWPTRRVSQRALTSTGRSGVGLYALACRGHSSPSAP